jgi:hypothetical protein
MTVTGGTQLPTGTQFSTTFNLTQDSPGVWHGTYANSSGSAESGTISGTVNGYQLQFTLVPTTSCNGSSYPGNAELSFNQTSMNGAYTGAKCGQLTSASFTATR